MFSTLFVLQPLTKVFCLSIVNRTVSTVSKAFRSFSTVKTMAGPQDLKVFNGKMDIHKGVTVDSSHEPCSDVKEFSSKLEASLKKWQEEKIRGVWFKVAVTHVFWIPILAENGFTLHHTKDDCMLLCRWLPRDEQNRIPAFAHTMIGAGGITINGRGQILVVCERYRDMPYWKLPGGYIEPGEDIVEGVKREVFEETSVETEFVSMVAFRHSKTAAFGCSDIYFVVELKPLSEQLKKEDAEIDAVQWMDIGEYLEHPLVHDNNRYVVRKYMENKRNGVGIVSERRYHPITNTPQALYSIANSILPHDVPS